MTPFETIYIDEGVAACNGGGGPLGHPRVYLNLAPSGRAECPYCSRLFVHRAAAAAGAEEGAGRILPHASQQTSPSPAGRGS